MRARIKANGVQLYKGHTYMSPIVGQLANGEEVELEGEYGCWVKVKDKGWVKAAHTEAIELDAGGVTSWNDLEDKPFGEEVGLVQIWPHDESEPFVGFEEGETYVVVYDGASREYEAWANGSNVHIGRDDPFKFGTNRGALTYTGDIDWDKLSSISHKTTVVTALDVKYLPESHQFYDMSTTIEWDGNTEGLTNVDGVFYKVSDLTPTFEELAGATIGIVFEGTYEEYPASESIEGGFAYNEGDVFAFGDSVIVALEDGVAFQHLDGIVFPDAGVYFGKFDEENACARLLSWGTIKKLDAKYLPEPLVLYVKSE